MVGRGEMPEQITLWESDKAELLSILFFFTHLRAPYSLLFTSPKEAALSARLFSI